MRYTFKQLEYFVAVAETGSIAGAAERIYISAPAISVAIAQLEQEWQVKLFVRQSTGLQLTTAGKWALQHARTLLESARDLYEHVSGGSGELRGKVAIGCLSTLAPLMLPDICQSFMQLYPAVELQLLDGDQDLLIGHLRRGAADLVVTYEMHIPKDLLFESLVALPPHLMMSAKHRLAANVCIDLRTLTEEDYILLDMPVSRDYFLSLFEAVNIEPRIRLRTTHFEVLRTLVANDFGVSIAVVRPRNEAALDGKLIISRPISNELPKLSIGVLTGTAALSRPAAALKLHIQSLVSDAYIPGMRPFEANPP